MPRLIARNPTPGEVERAAEVASLAFDNLSLEHWQESFHTVAELFGERFILIAELDGKIVSSLLCGPAPIVVNEAEVTHASVGAVGTLPECRNQGCAGAMMTQCVKLLREEGICASSLWPFSYEYYRKFGWEVGAEVRSYSAKGEVFAELGDASDARPATDDDFAGMKDLYRAAIDAHNCRTVRSDEWWCRIARLPKKLEMITEPGGRGVVVAERSGAVFGYAVYDFGADDTRRWIDVKELVCGDEKTKRDLLALIASIDPELSVSFSAAADDLFMHGLPNPRLVSVSAKPSFQFRVIDPERAMESLALPEEANYSLTLSISDPVFRHGFEFGVDVRSGRVSISKPGRRNRLEMDIQTMAKLYTGYLTPMDAWQMGKIVTDDVGALVTAWHVFPGLSPYRSGLDPG